MISMLMRSFFSLLHCRHSLMRRHYIPFKHIGLDNTFLMLLKAIQLKERKTIENWFLPFLTSFQNETVFSEIFQTDYTIYLPQ